MEAMSVAQRVSAEEYLAWDGPRGTNLVEGEIVMPQPRRLHQEILMRALHALRTWSEAGAGRGLVSLPLDVGLDDGNVYAPDVLWYRSARAPGYDDPRPYQLPDLAVEVRSPSTWRYEVGAKKTNYERHGLPELWLVDTAADEVLIFRRSKPAAPSFDVSEELARGEALTSPLLPGFTLALDALFA
ncbi:MAG: Uma2 family endonuclease [Solirubrobacterales bacterium]|jgi:Uma2 family endonuclease|nr:Uma2 family endonuclease [Solirubrobacterales bacterium]